MTSSQPAIEAMQQHCVGVWWWWSCKPRALADLCPVGRSMSVPEGAHCADYDADGRIQYRTT